MKSKKDVLEIPFFPYLNNANIIPIKIAMAKIRVRLITMANPFIII